MPLCSPLICPCTHNASNTPITTGTHPLSSNTLSLSYINLTHPLNTLPLPTLSTHPLFPPSPHPLSSHPLLGAIMTMFFAIFLLGLLLSEVAVSPTSTTMRVNKSGQINVVGLIVAVLLLTLFFLQEVGVVLLVGHTARRDPKAWSTAFFEGLSYSRLSNHRTTEPPITHFHNTTNHIPFLSSYILSSLYNLPSHTLSSHILTVLLMAYLSMSSCSHINPKVCTYHSNVLFTLPSPTYAQPLLLFNTRRLQC